LLSECDLIIVLENGSIKASGTYQELGRSGIDLSTILPPVAAVEAEDPAAALETPVDDEEDVAEDEDGDSVIIDRYREASFDKTPVVGLPPSTLRSLSRSGSVSESVPRKGSISTTPSTSLVPKSPASLTKKKAASVGAGAAAAAPSGALMTTEERSTGDVSSDIYWFYIRSGGLCIAIWFLFFLALVQGFSLGANFYLTYWGSQSINQEDHGHEMSSETNIKYMQVFAALSLAGVLCTIFRGFCLAQIQLTASLKLHKGVLDSILGAPVAFFDVTPLGRYSLFPPSPSPLLLSSLHCIEGRIVNRFSSDMTTIDETIAQSISQMTNTLFSVFGALVGIAVATNGTFLLIMVRSGRYVTYIHGLLKASAYISRFLWPSCITTSNACSARPTRPSPASKPSRAPPSMHTSRRP
jgi:ATP-binding cassette subfamily C (CFTR/MRP) protein 1